MKCPHCSAEEPEGVTECPSCGFVFAKWKSAAAAAQSRPSALRVSQEESSPVVLYGGLAAAAMAYFFFFRTPSQEARPPAPASAHAQEQAPAEGSDAPIPQAAAPMAEGPEGYWRFEGKVIDMDTGLPLEGAELSFFQGRSSAVSASAATNPGGRYAVAVPPRSEGGYSVGIRHYNFLSEYRTGSYETVPEEVRIRTGCPPKGVERPENKGNAKEATVLNFALCPKSWKR